MLLLLIFSTSSNSHLPSSGTRQARKSTLKVTVAVSLQRAFVQTACNFIYFTYNFFLYFHFFLFLNLISLQISNISNGPIFFFNIFFLATVPFTIANIFLTANTSFCAALFYVCIKSFCALRPGTLGFQKFI